MREKLEWAVKVLIVATFFVPLVVLPNSFIFPFIVPKILLFRSLVTLMLALYVILLFINWREYKIKMTPLSWALFAFFASFAISTFVGADPYHSFWDNHERMLGLFTILHYAAYYYLCSIFIKNWTGWKWFLRFFLLAGTAVMFVGLLQVGNPDLLLNQGSDRVIGTLGNSIYVGGYALFLIFVSTLLVLKEKNNVWRIVEIISLLLGFFGLFYSGTRGTMGGLFVGIIFCLVSYIFVLRRYAKMRFTLLLILLAVAAVFVLLYANRGTTFVENIPAVGRVVNTSLYDVMQTPRWIAWGIALESWKDRPIFGWGPNNFYYAFNQHYSPRSLEYGYGETWFDNAHNILMNTLAVQGTAGILSYLAIFVVALLSLFFALRKGRVDVHVAVIGAGFLVAHLVQNVTVFENPTSYLYFMFWLAMANKLTADNEQVVEKKEMALKNQPVAESVDRPVGFGAIIISGLVALLVIFVCDIQPARANMKTLAAIRLLSADPKSALPATRAALEFNSPHIDDIRSDIGRTASQVVASMGDKLGKDASNEILTLAYDNLSKNLTLHPMDIRNQLSLANLAQQRAFLNNDLSDMFDAEKYLSDALRYSPRRQQVIYSLSAVKMQLNKTSEAIQLLDGALKDDPKVGETYWRLAYTYAVANDFKQVRAVLSLAKENSVVFSDQEKEMIARISEMEPTTTVKSKK